MHSEFQESSHHTQTTGLKSTRGVSTWGAAMGNCLGCTLSSLFQIISVFVAKKCLNTFGSWWGGPLVGRVEVFVFPSITFVTENNILRDSPKFGDLCGEPGCWSVGWYLAGGSRSLGVGRWSAGWYLAGGSRSLGVGRWSVGWYLAGGSRSLGVGRWSVGWYLAGGSLGVQEGVQLRVRSNAAVWVEWQSTGIVWSEGNTVSPTNSSADSGDRRGRRQSIWNFPSLLPQR